MCLSYYMLTTPEEKIRVNARIPKSLYDFVCSKYDNISQAINMGLENLRESKADECHTPADSSIHPDIHPDIQVLTARIEEKERQLEEKDRHLETLKKELDDAGQREQDLKKLIEIT